MKSVLCAAVFSAIASMQVACNGAKPGITPAIPVAAPPSAKEKYPYAETYKIFGIPKSNRTADEHSVVRIIPGNSGTLQLVERVSGTNQKNLDSNFLESKNGSRWIRRNVFRSNQASIPVVAEPEKILWLSENFSTHGEEIERAFSLYSLDKGILASFPLSNALLEFPLLDSVESNHIRRMQQNKPENFANLVKEFLTATSVATAPALAIDQEGRWMALSSMGGLGVSLTYDSGRKSQTLIPIISVEAAGESAYSWNGSEYYVGMTGAIPLLAKVAQSHDPNFKLSAELNLQKLGVLILNGVAGKIPHLEIVQSAGDAYLAMNGIKKLKDGVVLFGAVQPKNGDQKSWIAIKKENGFIEKAIPFEKNSFVSAVTSEGASFYVGGSFGFSQAHSGSVDHMKGFVVSLDNNLNEKRRTHLSGKRTTRVLVVHSDAERLWVGGSTNGPDTHAEDRAAESFVIQVRK